MVSGPKNLLIFGSGRSGTSMVAGLLKDSGYFFGNNSNYLDSRAGNPKGFFEDLEVNTINEDILAGNLINIPEKIRRRFFSHFTFYRARWLAAIPLYYKLNANRAIEKRICNLMSREPYCFKDPRFSYTLPLWRPYLNPGTKFLVVYRDPHKTAQSILRECRETPVLWKLKLSMQKAYNIWYSMYAHILKNYRKDMEKENWFFLHYDQVFDENEISRLEEFLDVEVDGKFAKKSLSRTIDHKEYFSPRIERTYNKLNKLAHYENK